MLTLPLASAKLGFLPLFVAIVVVGLWFVAVYTRIARILAYNVDQMVSTTAALLSRFADRMGVSKTGFMDRIDEVAYEAELQRGPAQFDELIRTAGMGKAASTSLLLGMLWYVVLANIGYLLIGGVSLSTISYSILPLSWQPNIFIACAGLSIVGLSSQLHRIIPATWILFGLLRKITLMVGMWTFGLSLLRMLSLTGAVQRGDVFSKGIELILFLASVVGTMLLPEPEEHSANSGDMTSEHQVGVALVITEIAILCFVSLAAVFFFWKHGLLVVPDLAGSYSLSFSSLSHWANMIGIVIFAYVGTGLFNIVRYRQLFHEGNSEQAPIVGVLRVGTLIPMGVYLCWTMVVAITLDSGTLTMLDESRSYTTVGIASKIRPVDTLGALVLEISGYFLALFAVTSACKGSAESLSDRLLLWFRNVRPPTRPTPPATAQRRRYWISLAIIFVSTLLAFYISSCEIMAITPILSVAGNAGGGLLLLVLPFFFHRPEAKKVKWRDAILGLTTAFFLATLGILTIYTSIDISGAIGYVLRFLGFGIALSVPCMAIWLIVESKKRHVVKDSSLLHVIPFFKEIDDSTLSALSSRFVIENFSAGQTVCKMGDPGDKAYIIVSGKIEVLITSADGEERQIAVLGEGDYFGEMALLEKMSRTATVRTLRPTTLITLERRQFYDVVDNIPEIRIRFKKIAEERRLTQRGRKDYKDFI